GVVDRLGDLFGSLPSAAWTLFAAATHGETWPKLADPLSEVGPAYFAVLLLYIVFVVLGMLNIITGVFVNVVFEGLSLGRGLDVDNVSARPSSFVQRLMSAFIEAGIDPQGPVSWEELSDSIVGGGICIKASLMMLDIGVPDAQRIFNVLDKDGTGRISLLSFVEACVALQGVGKAVDIGLLQWRLDSLSDTITSCSRLPAQTAAVAVDST
ncbi:unnamed protein product, partial [Polarella glacialis]